MPKGWQRGQPNTFSHVVRCSPATAPRLSHNGSHSTCARPQPRGDVGRRRVRAGAPVAGGHGDYHGLPEAPHRVTHAVGLRPQVVLCPLRDDGDAQAGAKGDGEDEALATADAALPGVHDADAGDEDRGEEECCHAPQHAVRDAREERRHLGKDAQ